MEKYNINPTLDSELLSVLFKLEPLRYDLVKGTTPSWLFYDLKEVMHLLESLASARIEGNHTTLISAADDVVNKKNPTDNEDLSEIANIREAIYYIEENIKQDTEITIDHIKAIHRITMSGLTQDTSKTPGEFRKIEVEIQNSKCINPPHTLVEPMMEELLQLINEPNQSKYDIVKTAVVHHKLTVIHPFDNGNGRTARALTYAMLIKQGFLRKNKAILNPSSIFCIDRDKYYDMLSKADTHTAEGTEEWCLYVALGIHNELQRVYKLLDKDYAMSAIMLPALKMAKDSQLISEKDHAILKIAMEKDVLQAKDVSHLFGFTASANTQRSRYLSGMVEKNLLMRSPKNPKKYLVRFMNRYLLPSVLFVMDKNGLIPVKDDIVKVEPRKTVEK